MSTWSQAVEDAIRRQAATSTDGVFTRAELIENELPRIVADLGTVGATPEQTLSRELQQARERGIIEFVDDQGTYRLTD